jgi:ACT domain-containing protein
MNKIKVVTFKGALKLLDISNRTFYLNYRNHVQPVGTKGKANLYSINDLKRRQKELGKEDIKKFEIVE